MTTYSDEVLADSPVAYWKLNEASGATIFDSSGNGHNGTIVGTVERGRVGNCAIGAALATRFYGGAYADLPYFAGAALAGSWTLESWFRVTGTTDQYPAILMLGASAQTPTSGGWYYYPAYNGFFPATSPASLAYKRGGSTIDSINIGGNGFDPQRHCMHHYVLTYDATTTTARIYHDADLWTETSITWAAASSTTPFRIGLNAEYPHYINADLSHIAMYSSALSGERIARHFAAGACPDCGGESVGWRIGGVGPIWQQ